MDISAAKHDLRPRHKALTEAGKDFQAATLDLANARSAKTDPAELLRLERASDEKQRLAERAQEDFLDHYLPIRDHLWSERKAAKTTEQRAAAMEAVTAFEAEFGVHTRDEPM
jgi:hypothetical protein